MTLKRFILTAAFVIPAIVVYSQNYSNIEFIENKGQWDKQVKFKGDVDGGAFFIRSGGFTVLQHNKQDLSTVYSLLHGFNIDGTKVTGKEKPVLHSHAYQVDFLDASTELQIIPDKPLSTYNNYFIGNDPSKWAGGCKIYQAITVKNIYPNVDVRYFTNNGVLAYDIIAKPGADISKIALKYEGADKLKVKNKELVVGTSVGDLKESSPYTYQTNGVEKKELDCKYTVKDNVVRFDIKDYDPNSTIVIDPTLVFCSFSGSTADNWGYTATYGPDGSMYGGGIVFGNGFPVSIGAFQTLFQGGDPNFIDGAFDIGLIKLTPNGANRVYATYLGGSGNEQPHSLIVDPQGNLIVAGRTNSPNYPVTPGGNIGSGGGYDIVVTKLNATGTGLIGSVKIGGSGDDGVNISAIRAGSNSLQQNYGDDGRSEVQIDGAGNIYVASSTQSLDFPTVGGFQTSNKGGGNNQDGVVLKFNSNLSSVLFSTYLGGSGNDAAYVIDLAPNGNIYVGGGTESKDFPGVPGAGVIYSSNQGGIDGFVSEISNDGSTLIKSTYIGTSGIDQVYGIKFDKNGFPYVVGQSTGSFPINNALYSNPGSKQFIAKLQPDLSAYVYSTVFGSPTSTPQISPVAFLVDRCENVYVSGWGGWFGGQGNNFYGSAGTIGMPVTPDAIKKTTDGKDFYFFVLKKDAVAQLFGSFYGESNNLQQGGGGTDHVDGGTSRFDRNGVIYQAMCANCNIGGKIAFPTTPGTWAPNNPAVTGAQCNLALLKISFNLAGVGSGIRASINGAPYDSSGCAPLTVLFTDTIHNAQSYEWHFGDGSPVQTTLSPTYTITHTYNAVGTYIDTLISIDPTTCNITDTSYCHIRVGNDSAFLNFSAVKLPPCNSFTYQFTNSSTTQIPVPAFTNQSFVWNFGDGSPRTPAGIGSIVHNFPGPGTYNVNLVLVDTSYCNSPDSMTMQVSVASLVKAQFTTSPTGCAPYNAVFNNTSIAGQTFQWDFGDGTNSTASNPTHLYSAPGSYTITLIANNPSTCNMADTTQTTINVFANPVAAFSYLPNPPVQNTPTTFTNLSSPDAILFKWSYGDGDTLLTSSRLPVQHQYNATGTFNACLTAYNSAGCADSVCQPVAALVKPLVDLPNAFTPQNGGINSIIKVRGFGIAKMRFMIWNRWGEKVFESSDPNTGWDGKYKGALQPMDVYAYTLDVVFFDGSKTTKKGDITLIR